MKRARSLLTLAAVAVAIAVAMVASTARATGGLPWGGGGGSFTKALADTLYCKLTSCTMTGATSYSGTNPDISTPGAEDLNLLPGSGIVEIKKSGSSILKFIDGSGNSANITWAPNGFSITNVAGAGAIYLNSGTFPGRTGNQTATTVVGGFHDSETTSSAGTGLFEVYGEGLETAGSGGVQTVTCATGTVSIDPQSSVIIVDAAAAACTATIATTSMGTVAQEGLPIRISTKNVGAGQLKLAATNFSVTPPTRCTTTGFVAGQSVLIAYDKDQTKWTFLGGCE